jgi:DNA-directed RNA polymerase specialized sigma24 family protein
LVGSLTLYTGDRDLGEELAQESLIRVYEHWDQVREAESPSAWAHRVGLNLAKWHFRRRAVLRRLQQLEGGEPRTSEPAAEKVAALQRLGKTLHLETVGPMPGSGPRDTLRGGNG